MRGFEKTKDYQYLNFELPKRSTDKSAGYDLALIEDLVIPAKSIRLGKTGVKAYMQEGEVLKIHARSSLALKKGLMLANGVGVVDHDYYGNPDNDGHIMISLYNFTNQDILLKKGERVAQGIFEKYLTIDNDETQNKNRQGGFGSTGI